MFALVSLASTQQRAELMSEEEISDRSNHSPSNMTDREDSESFLDVPSALVSEPRI